MAHASEAMHWYTRDGKPAYTVKSRDGSDRPATLRDARKINLVPSVTSVIRCAAAPGLERWKLDQMLHAALTLPRMPDEAEAEWISRVWVDSQETAKKAAEKGTAIHAAIQGYYETGRCEKEYDEHVSGAMQAIEVWLPGGVWTPEKSFSHVLGFGGKVDLSCSFFAVADFKSKEFDLDAELKTWDEHAMQLGAYRMGLGMPQAKAAICYVSTTNPGLSRLLEIPEEELQRGWECFKSLLSYWKAKNKYDSAFAEREAA